jgi:hypothetical protein
LADKLYDFQVMKKSLTTFILILFSALSYAGTNDSLRPIQVGDSVVLGNCSAPGYKYLQYYRKTRFPEPNATYNKQTGEDFYDYFFSNGDFDVKQLTCEYALKKYRVVCLKVFADKKTGAERPVMFLEIGPNTVVWVELEGAVASMEVYIE